MLQSAVLEIQLSMYHTKRSIAAMGRGLGRGWRELGSGVGGGELADG